MTKKNKNSAPDHTKPEPDTTPIVVDISVEDTIPAIPSPATTPAPTDLVTVYVVEKARGGLRVSECQVDRKSLGVPTRIRPPDQHDSAVAAIQNWIFKRFAC